MTTLDMDLAQPKIVDLGGYRMAYREWGNRTATEAVILVHGITSSSLSWIRVGPRLGQRWRVIAVDLKGHGDSDRPPAGYRHSDQADEVVGLCTALGLTQVSVVGHSWGGAIALVLATRSGLATRRLILEDPAIGQRATSPDQTAQRRLMMEMYAASVGLSREQAEARARPNLAHGWTEQDVVGRIDASVKGRRAAIQAVFDENGRWDLAERFADLRCPTLLLRAEVARGGIVGQTAVALAQANPLIRAVTIAEADHNIHAGRFDAFMAEVEPFLAAAQQD